MPREFPHRSRQPKETAPGKSLQYISITKAHMMNKHELYLSPACPWSLTLVIFGTNPRNVRRLSLSFFRRFRSAMRFFEYPMHLSDVSVEGIYSSTSPLAVSKAVPWWKGPKETSPGCRKSRGIVRGRSSSGKFNFSSSIIACSSGDWTRCPNFGSAQRSSAFPLPETPPTSRCSSFSCFSCHSDVATQELMVVSMRRWDSNWDLQVSKCEPVLQSNGAVITSKWFSAPYPAVVSLSSSGCFESANDSHFEDVSDLSCWIPAN